MEIDYRTYLMQKQKEDLVTKCLEILNEQDELLREKDLLVEFAKYIAETPYPELKKRAIKVLEETTP